jgi:hypothetical protein
MLSRFLIIPLLVLASASFVAPTPSFAVGPETSVAPLRKYVNSLSDFMIHTEAHIARVETIGMDIADKFPEFKDVDLKLLRAYLGQHDKAKVQGWEKQGSIARELYPFYGKNFEELTGEEKAKLKAVRDDLLKPKDERISKNFLEHHGLIVDGRLTPMGKLFERIAMIADQVDRVMCPVSKEEWGKNMDPATTSKWLDNEDKVQEAKDRAIAGHYEGVRLDDNGKAILDSAGRVITNSKAYDSLIAKNEFIHFKMLNLVRCYISTIRAMQPQALPVH